MKLLLSAQTGTGDHPAEYEVYDNISFSYAVV